MPDSIKRATWGVAALAGFLVGIGFALAATTAQVANAAEDIVVVCEQSAGAMERAKPRQEWLAAQAMAGRSNIVVIPNSASSALICAMP